MTVDELRSVYSQIYRAGENVIHPSKGKLGKYAVQTNRDFQFLEFLESHLPAPATVLDASCGRGHLLRELMLKGYEARGTEFVPFVVSEDLKGLPVNVLAYHELKELGFECFDAVISNDVLEHLPSEGDVIDAIRNFCFISKKWVMISVGCNRALKYPTSLKMKNIGDLHQVKRKPIWWAATVNRFVELDFQHSGGVNWFGFGRKRAQ